VDEAIIIVSNVDSIVKCIRGGGERRSNSQQLALDGAGDDGTSSVLGGGRAGNHIDLAADAEVAGKVDAGLDGEAGVGQEETLVVGLEVVEVRAVAVE